MNTTTRPPTATPSQLDTIRNLIAKAGCYDRKTITLMHRRLGVDDRWQGKPVDLWLGSLTRQAAHDLIVELIGQVGDV